MATVTVKQHDTARPLQDTLLLGGNPIDLTDAAAVLILQHNSGEPVRRPATVTDATAGKVEYDLVSADTAVSGMVLLEWEITFPGGKILTVPDGACHVLNILADLG